MRYLLITGGEIKDYSWLKESIDSLNPDAIIAVDSGADHLEKINIKADLLVGDLDSISTDGKKYYEDNNLIKELNAEKDETDTNVALDYAIRQSADEVFIIPGIGKRADHSYANVLLLKKALDNGVNAYLKNENNIVFMKNMSFKVKEQKGTTISFFAMFGDVDITLKGFYYPLSNYHLKMDDPIGVSNVIAEEDASVEFDKGMVLAILSID